MALNFTSVGQEIAYWLGHIGQDYSPGRTKTGAPIGEWGIDVTLPLDTPVYAVAPGPVLGAGYYGGGGVVSEQIAPGQSLYYQHLDQIVASVGQSLKAGDLIGYSGGQNVGGSHPSTPALSSWPHIEVGVNAPWSGPWMSEGQSVNPKPLLAALETGSSVATFGGTAPAGCQNNTPIIGFFGTAFCNLSSAAGNLVTTITGIVLQVLIRIGVILAGAVLIFLALRVLLRDTAGSM